jgi:hypothetical protein
MVSQYGLLNRPSAVRSLQFGDVRLTYAVDGVIQRPGTLGFSYHFGDQAFGRVVGDEEGFPVWEPIPAVALLQSPRP